MQKYIISIAIVFCMHACVGQTRNNPFALYSTIGVKSGLGFSSIYNPNMSGDENLEYDSGMNYSIGVKSSINYVGKKTINKIYGIHIDYLYDFFTLKCPKMDNNLGAYSKTIKYKTKNIAVLGRFTSVSKKFMIECGPQFTSYRVIDIKNFGIHPNNAFYSAGFNYRENYKNYTSLVFSIGIYMKYFNVALKQSYSLNSITTENGNPVKDGFYNHPSVNPDYARIYNDHAATTHYSAQITIEYYIPFIKLKRYWRGKTEVSAFEKVDPIYYWGNNLD